MKHQPGPGSRPPYLFLLARPSPTVRREAANRLREMGLKVVAQYGRVAVEALATPEQARAAHDLGMFSGVFKSSVKRDHLERLTDEQRRVVEQWNTRFSPDYRRLKEDPSLEGRSWADPDMDPPAPHSAIEPRDFSAFLEDYERRTGERASESPEDEAQSEQTGRRRGRRTRRRPSRSMTPDEFVKYEQDLARQFKDPTVGYHLARLAASLGPAWYERIRTLRPEFVKELFDYFFPEAACWELSGEIALGIVFVESSQPAGPRFTDTERAQVHQEIIDGLNLLASEHPGNDLSWVYDEQFIRIDAPNGDDSEANCPNLTALEDGWRDPAMAQVTYNGHTYTASWSSVGQYREHMRVANSAAHAIVIFVTPYANCWHAYAGGGRAVLAKHNDWGGWGRGSLDRITAHEVTHLFGSADEYTSKMGCSTCDSVHGCDNIPNGNCGTCARPQQSCMMHGNSRRICAYTRGQIGWSHLFVELTTANVDWAGTDDTVWLDIGDREFVLDTANHDDRERNNREGYALWAPELRREHIKRIMIRKSPDGSNGGWMLGGVRVWFDGSLICDQPRINKWLEDGDRTWVGCISDRDVIHTLEVRVTTADVRFASTDDDVWVSLSGRFWDLDNPGHDDFQRGNTDSFFLDPGPGLHLENISTVGIFKAPDGFAGGWKLKGVEVIANGSTIYNNQSINKWLEDDDRIWEDIF
jgi:hypothetical protein